MSKFALALSVIALFVSVGSLVLTHVEVDRIPGVSITIYSADGKHMISQDKADDWYYWSWHW